MPEPVETVRPARAWLCERAGIDHPLALALTRFFFHAEPRDPSAREQAWGKILAFLDRVPAP